MDTTVTDVTPAEHESAPGALALVARRPIIVAGASLAAALAAAAYIELFAVINPTGYFANQRPQYVLLTTSSAVACLVALVALAGVRSWAGRAARRRLESGVLSLVALTYGLQAAAQATMVGDFHAAGAFAPSGLDQTFQWTGDIAGVALFSLLVVDAILAADSGAPAEVWWRTLLVLAAGAALVSTVVKLTAALTNVVYSLGDEAAIGVAGVATGVLIAASAVRREWWWRVAVGFGLVVTGVAYVALGRSSSPVTLAHVGECSLGIAFGYVVLAVTGVVFLVRTPRASRTPPDPAPYPD